MFVTDTATVGHAIIALNTSVLLKKINPNNARNSRNLDLDLDLVQ